MTEQERLVAISLLMDWGRQDETIKEMTRVVLAHTQQPAVGHLARHHPEVFDELFEEAEAMILNPD